MKVNFKYGIKVFSGTIDEMVFGAYRQGNVCIGRKWVMPTLTVNNTTLGNIARNLADIYAQAKTEYKTDLATYAVLNAAENLPPYQIPPNRFGVFIKMMYAWQASDPTHVDLATVTIDDIMLTSAAVKTVAGAIEAGFLEDVTGSANLNHAIADES